MSKLVGLISGVLLLVSCTERERSEVEIVKYDKRFIQDIKSKYDSTYLEASRRTDFWNIEHYVTGTTDKMIFKDSLNNIIGIIIRENGVHSFAQEYYPNGQAKAKTKFKSGTIDGPATYYYEDGRIKSIGLWENYKRVGQWKEYDKDGFLKSIEYFDKNGKLEKEERIE